MSATAIETIRDRIASVCCGAPFAFRIALTPFSFDLQPSGQIDEVVRIETSSQRVTGGLSYTEDRIDQIAIWVARKHAADPEATYRRLLVDARSLTSAIVVDGATGGGDYDVADGGRGFQIQRQPNAMFAVARLSFPVNYEAVLV